MKKIGSLTFVLLLTTILLAEVEVLSSVSNSKISLDELLIYQITVRGVENPPQPEFPETTDLKLVYQNRYNEYLIAEGRSTFQVNFVYYLRALRTGKIIVPEISYRISEYQFRLQEKQIEIIPAGQKVKFSEKASSIKKQKFDQRHFLTLDVDKSEAYLNEAIELKILLYTTDLLNEVALISEPDFRGFYHVWDQLKPNRYELKDIDGERYRVYEVKRGVLFPLSPGKFELNPFEFELKFSNPQSVNTLPLHLSTDPIFLQIRPLDIKQKGFLPVGMLSMETIVPSAWGDSEKPLEVVYRLQGNCNFNFFSLSFPDKNSDFEVINRLEKRSFVFMQGGGFIAFYEVRFLLNPLKAEVAEIPLVEVAFFNPQKNELEFIRSPARKINLLRTTKISGERGKQKKELNLVFRRGFIFDQSSQFLEQFDFWLILLLPLFINLLLLAIYYKKRLAMRPEIALKSELKTLEKTIQKSAQLSDLNRAVERLLVILKTISEKQKRGVYELLNDYLQSFRPDDLFQLKAEVERLIYSGQPPVIIPDRMKKDLKDIIHQVRKNV